MGHTNLCHEKVKYIEYTISVKKFICLVFKLVPRHKVNISLRIYDKKVRLSTDKF